MTDRRGAAAVLGAAVLWGTVGTAQELGAPQAAPATVAAVRSFAGGLALLGAVTIAGRLDEIRAVVRRALWPTVVAAIAMTVFQLGYLGGIRRAGVALGTLVAIGSAPPVAGLLSWLGGVRPDRRWAMATVAAIAGAAILLLAGSEVTADPAGVAFGLLAGSAYASYAVASKRVLLRGLAGPSAMAVVFTGSGLLLAPVLVVGDLGWVVSGTGLVAAAWLTLATIVVAYTLFGLGLARVDAPTATTLTLAEPLTAAVLAVTLVGERLGAAATLGAALLVLGLVLTTLPAAPAGQARVARRARSGRH